MCGNKNNVYICTPETMISVARCEAFARRAVGKPRRDAGVVDRAALEMRCTGNCTGGSNPSLSAEALPTERRKPANDSFAGFFVRYARYDVVGEGMRLRPNRSGPLSAAARTLRTNKRRRRLHICKRLSTFGASIRRGARVVEEARLESSYTSQAYQGFESPSLREFAADAARTPARILAGVSFFAVRISVRFFEWPPAGFRVPRLRLSIPRRPVFVARVGGAFYR